ncbi:hypothetical protein ACF0H5_021153 [Mactra antiquata]
MAGEERRLLSNEDTGDVKRASTSYRLRTISVICGGLLVHLCLGSYYIFGNISPYMISYLRNRTTEHTLSNVDNLWIVNAGAIVAPFGMTLGGILDRHFGVKIAVFSGCFLFCCGVAATYFTIQKSLVLVSLTYGALTNFGSSVAYGPPAQTCCKWLPSRPTFAVGIIVCGFGGGAFIFNQVATRFINPDNLSPDFENTDGQKYFTDKHVLDRVPGIFLLLAGIYVVSQTIGILIIADPPDYKNLAKMPDDNGSDRNLQRPSTKQLLLGALKNKNMYVVVIFLCFVFGGTQFAINLYKAYGQTFISDDHFFALVGSISSVFNALSRPLWGLLMDRYGFQVASKILATSFVCLSFTIVNSEHLGKAAFFIWICATYATFSGIFALTPSALGKLFGIENMAIVMGFNFFAVAAATIAGGLIGINLESVLGWHGLFFLAGCLGIGAFIVTFFFDGKDSEGKMI